MNHRYLTLRNLTYDANGNILTMTQKGLKINTSPVIDSLLYGYAANSNQLLYVTVKANDTAAHLGDFTEINNNTTQDYWYDGNGNYTKDNNKGISAVTYNFMNLPQQVTVTNKGTISYVYDAAGNKLQKKITEGARIVTTTYISGYVYQNDTLQYALTGEGRVRYLPSSGGAGRGPVYDYFIKDHLGNVRMVLTDEKDTAFYPAATFEDANIATEQLFFDNVDEQRTSRPGSFFTSSTNGNKVQLLRKSVQSKGAGQLLKVMSGDKLHIKVDYYIPSQTTDNNTANGLNTIISALASVIDNNPVTGSLHGSGSAITGNLNTSTPFTSFMSPQTGTAGTSLPKAYLNIVFFDEQFKFVSENSEAVQVTTEGSGQTIYRLGANAKEAAKNGYVYIYVSNESNNLVYFDNLQITHEKGPLLEESHYYPFGTEMKGISSRSLPSYIPNRYKANSGAEYGDEEWSNGTGLEMYETFYRSYNAETGRFMQGDPMMEATVTMSGYVFSGNNPVMFTDLLGDQYQYMDRNGNKWHHEDVLEGTALEGYQFVVGYGFIDFVGLPTGGGSDNSKFWKKILDFANGDGAGYVVGNDGEIISDPSSFEHNSVWLRKISRDKYGIDQTSFEYLGTLGGVVRGDKIIFNLLKNDLREAESMTPGDFYSAVDDHKRWDYKTNKDYIFAAAVLFDRENIKYGYQTKFLFRGYSMTAEDFGNFHYGVTGLATGKFTETVLFVAAGLVQIKDRHSRPEWRNSTYFGDDPKDHYWIQQGFNYYYSIH